MARFDTDKATRFGLGLRFSAVETLEFLDYGGCNILHHVSSELSASVDPNRFAAPTIVGRMFEQGLLGLKSGHGFYDSSGRDFPAYRRNVLARSVSALEGAGLWRPAQRRSCLD